MSIKKIMSRLLLVILIVIGCGMVEVYANTSSYSISYDASKNKVDGIKVGNKIYCETKIDIKNLGDDKLTFVFYELEEQLENGNIEQFGYRRFSKADEKYCVDNGYEYSYQIGTLMYLEPSYDITEGWTVTKTEYDKSNKEIRIYVITNDIIEKVQAVTLNFDWSSFEKCDAIGVNGSLFDEFWIKREGTGLKPWFDPYRLVYVKATKTHVDAGYISENDYKLSDDGWVLLEKYSKSYRYSADDEYRYYLRLYADAGYAFSESTKIIINDDKVELIDSKIQENSLNRWLDITLIFHKDGYISKFEDVVPGKYYEKPVYWAVENGITSGVGNRRFAPEEACTRAQAVTFLWRAAGKPEPESVANPFTDVKEGAYYYKAVLWAMEQGITAGKTETTFSPSEKCARAQIVTFLWRANGKPVIETENEFVDVTEKNYFYQAVQWAVSEGITAGKTETAFDPNGVCTRAQIVTFLYRDAFNL